VSIQGNMNDSSYMNITALSPEGLRPRLVKLAKQSLAVSWRDAKPNEELGTIDETSLITSCGLTLKLRKEAIQGCVFVSESDDQNEYITTAEIYTATRDPRSILAERKKAGVTVQRYSDSPNKVSLIEMGEKIARTNEIFRFNSEGSQDTENPNRKRAKVDLSEDELKYRLFNVLNSQEGLEGFTKPELTKLTGSNSGVVTKILNTIADSHDHPQTRKQVFTLKKEYRSFKGGPAS